MKITTLILFLLVSFSGYTQEDGETINENNSYSLIDSIWGTEKQADLVKLKEQLELIIFYHKDYGENKNIDSMLFWMHVVGVQEMVGVPEMDKMVTQIRSILVTKYLNGIDLERDNYKAYLWFLIYNENKKHLSKDHQKIQIEEIVKMKMGLSIEELNHLLLNSERDAEKMLGRKLLNLDKINLPE